MARRQYWLGLGLVLVACGAVGLVARAVELQLLDHGFLARQGDLADREVVIQPGLRRPGPEADVFFAGDRSHVGDYVVADRGRGPHCATRPFLTPIGRGKSGRWAGERRVSWPCHSIL